MLGYFDFPGNARAFAEGQSDARLRHYAGGEWRLRGRTTRSLTLIRFRDARAAGEFGAREKARGNRVTSLNFTSPRPEDLPTRNGPTEWWVPRGWTSRGAALERRERRPTLLASFVTDAAEARDLFERWAAWAAGRHFMVHRGHYLRWLAMHFEESRGVLLGYRTPDGKLVGMFGAEAYRNEWVVVVAKHTPECPASRLWVDSLNVILRDFGAASVRCGSTADGLKRRLGMRGEPSWMFDWRKPWNTTAG